MITWSDSSLTQVYLGLVLTLITADFAHLFNCFDFFIYKECPQFTFISDKIFRWKKFPWAMRPVQQFVFNSMLRVIAVTV